MDNTARPKLGVVESPDLASALTLLGFDVIGAGTAFRDSAKAIRQVGEPIPVLIPDVKSPGIRPWVERVIGEGSPVVVLDVQPSAGAIPASTGVHLTLPMTINQVLAYVGYGQSPHALGEAEVRTDGSIPEVAQYRDPTASARTEPEDFGFTFDEEAAEPETEPVVPAEPEPSPAAAVNAPPSGIPAWALEDAGITVPASEPAEEDIAVVAEADESELGDYPQPLTLSDADSLDGFDFTDVPTPVDDEFVMTTPAQGSLEFESPAPANEAAPAAPAFEFSVAPTAETTPPFATLNDAAAAIANGTLDLPASTPVEQAPAEPAVHQVQPDPFIPAAPAATFGIPGFDSPAAAPEPETTPRAPFAIPAFEAPTDEPAEPAFVIPSFDLVQPLAEPAREEHSSPAAVIPSFDDAPASPAAAEDDAPTPAAVPAPVPALDHAGRAPFTPLFAEDPAPVAPPVAPAPIALREENVTVPSSPRGESNTVRELPTAPDVQVFVADHAESAAEVAATAPEPVDPFAVEPSGLTAEDPFAERLDAIDDVPDAIVVPEAEPAWQQSDLDLNALFDRPQEQLSFEDPFAPAPVAPPVVPQAVQPEPTYVDAVQPEPAYTEPVYEPEEYAPSFDELVFDPATAGAPAPQPAPATEPAAESVIDGFDFDFSVLDDPQPAAAPTEVPAAFAGDRHPLTATSNAVIRATPNDISANAGKLIASIAGKGGVGKTTTALHLAERAAETGMRVILVDANRGQGDVRKYLRAESPGLPSIYNLAVTGDPMTALITPDQLNTARGPHLPPVHFGVILAPPPTLADPSVVSATVYAQALAFALANADLVVLDTQIAEGYDTSGLFDHIIVPSLAQGAWAYGIADSSRPGVENLLERVKAFAAAGVDRSRVLLVMNEIDRFTDKDRQAAEARFAEYSTLLGGIGKDPAIEARMNAGEIRTDHATMRPVIDAALYAITGNEQFRGGTTSKPVKRRGLFGRGR